ncbi:MAG: Hsp70 family protein [Gammaproteobacteria bacterium]|nr:Hsp70 family protein [Gammaproteobacteria bacterium]
MKKLPIGIDLGTTNSVVAYLENSSIKYLRFRNQESISSVMLYKDGKVTIGSMAKKKAVSNPSNFIKSSKVFMGDSDKVWNIEDKVFTPTDIAGEILKEIRKMLDKKFPDVSRFVAVITVPAYFTSTQIDETKKAGEMAGFTIKQIITEPVSAAVAYGFEDELNQKLFIVDIGGGTFDTSILKVSNRDFETLAIDGDNKLGGDDFDNYILEYLLKHIRKERGVNLASLTKSGISEEEYNKSKQVLIAKSEEVKKELSEYDEVEVEISNLLSGYNLSTKISRVMFEEMASITIDKIKRTIKKTLDDSQHSSSNIDKVVLVGGSSKIPIVRKFVTELFGKAPYSDKPLDKLVAMGAAIIAQEDNAVNIRDIISHSLGIEVVDDKFSPILKRNDHYPISHTQTYTTTVDFQQSVDVNVYEGEDEDDVHNDEFYGGFALTNIEQAHAGVPQIEVTFEFDKNRILKITAKDLGSGSVKSENIEIDKGVKKKITPDLKPFDIALVIDVSGSMCGYPLEKAKEACTMMVSSMIDLNSHRVGLVEFDSYANTLAYLSNDRALLENAIANLSCKGGTDIADGLRETRQEVLVRSENRKLVILVTDGGSSENPAILESNRLKTEGARVVSIGVGQGVNEGLLENIASNGDYYQIDSIDDLENIFQKISSSLKVI